MVGTSGSGKSSLVRSGLIPSLYSGVMVGAGSSWRVAMLRPGEDPIGHLASALNAPDVLGTDEAELATTNEVLVEATLRRGTLGLADAARQARLPPHENLLVVVDQFEELFRFRRSRQIENSRDEAIAFVKLLLEATRQNDVPVYVVLTMRSDFIGDCMAYPGLPDAVNNGQYLVPRMSRDELRSAITGPVAVGGGAIAPRLVLRLLNDLGDDQDQLPVLQHALMRTWDQWERHRRPGEAIDIADYEAVGTLQRALSLHAEEAYLETGSDRGVQIAERLFKALTDTFSDPRGVRRPTSVEDLAAICEATELEVIEIVDVFRRPGRSFLMPPSAVPLDARSIVDLSHESLMRCWARLIAWADEDRASAGAYARLSQAAGWFEEGSAGLWRNPELELGLRWRRDNRPTAAWAHRHDDHFERAMAFLDRSQQERDRAEAEQEREHKRTLTQARWAAGVFATLFIVAGLSAYVAWRENARAGRNLQLARDAVDQTLSSAGLDPARAGADVPQMEQFRTELLEKAKLFYVGFLKQDSGSEELRNEMAFAHFRLGHIHRLLGKADEAAGEYGQAIAQFDSLAKEYPKADYQSALGNAYNWLGETLRPAPDRFAEAEKAYDSALLLQQRLLRERSGNGQYEQELARSYYNRGILRSSTGAAAHADSARAEADFREAIRLLEPLAQKKTDRLPSLELARACNNLGSLVAEDDTRLPEAKELYERAVRIDEESTRAEPDNRVYKLELAQFDDNLADLLRRLRQFDLAKERSRQALDLLDELAAPAPSLGIEHADAHSLRGRILQSEGSRGAAGEYEQSLEIFEKLQTDRASHHLALFHERFGDLLLNLAALSRETGDVEGVRRLLARAVTRYLELAHRSLAAGSVADAQTVFDNLTTLLPALSERDRSTITKLYEDLRDQLAARK